MDGQWILNAGRGVFGLAAKMAAAISPLDRKYRIRNRLLGPWPEGPCLWLHGASLGECKVLMNLARMLRRDLENGPEILVTTQKVEVVPILDKMGEGQVRVSLAPADTPQSMREFIRTARPVALILAENELWPGYLSAMSAVSQKPSVALVSGRYLRSFPGMDFSSLGFACMQTAADCARFSKASKFRPIVGGDWKLLSLLNGTQTPPPSFEKIQKDIDWSMLSVHFAEWKFLAPLVHCCVQKNESVVLMPRRLEEVERFRRELSASHIDVMDWPEARQGKVTLIDKFGLTSQILGRTRHALVGGSFCKKPGIHDFWEPLLAGCPTCVGPCSFGHTDLVNSLVGSGLLTRLSSADDFENLDLENENQVPGFLLAEKEKVSNSYQQLLLFLKDLFV